MLRKYGELLTEHVGDQHMSQCKGRYGRGRPRMQAAITGSKSARSSWLNLKTSLWGGYEIGLGNPWEKSYLLVYKEKGVENRAFLFFLHADRANERFTVKNYKDPKELPPFFAEIF